LSVSAATLKLSLLLLLAAGKHVQVYMDLDKTGANIMTYRDIENERE
jgi:hypothetical protein